MLFNISRSKNTQAMKFGQLIECNMTNVFLEKSYTKCDGETSTRLFSEKLKLRISLNNSLEFYTVCFYCMPNRGLSKFIETRVQTTCFYLILGFLKRDLELVSPVSFSSHFLKKSISLVIFY